MHRILVDRGALSEENPILPGAALRHLKVVRLRDGEPVELFDGQGSWRVFSYSQRGLSPLGALCHEDRGERRRLVMFACVTKGSRWDWTIEKATELGVTQIVPVLSARTIVRIGDDERESKRMRWQRIAEDAARQSDAKWLPEICVAVDFSRAAELAAECDCYVGALAVPPPRDILSAVESGCAVRGTRPLAVFVGPEGDFTPEELGALVKIATPVSFGPTVLRAETAAIYGIAVLRAFLDSHAA